MLREIYCIKDIKVAAFISPFAMANEVHAKRYFHELCNDETSTINKYPSDYELFRLGTFDDSSGEMVTEIEFLCNAVSAANEVNTPAHDVINESV